MTDEEQHIVDFLPGSPDACFARKEIARKAVKRNIYEENPRWADGALAWLLDKQIVEANDGGHIRLVTDNKYRRSG